MTQRAPYSKQRFAWKRGVRASNQLARRTKHFAAFVCDEFVSSKNGCFWASNRTLAGRFDVHERSIQRYLRELETLGWIQRIRRRGIRRVFKIVMPFDAEHDVEHDSKRLRCATKMSSKGDKAVAPYKNKGKNKVELPFAKGVGGFHWFDERDTSTLREWKTFIATHSVLDVEMLVQLLRRNSCIAFPARFPNPDEADRYMRFFDDVVLSKGRSIGNVC
ncbi:helix-turn-helix domain-containing protein [Ruegeria jejuensis]|uniref:helix-turn-helix domain-containing protein n=1 Tax=Ruegeria jejuensis TaxID=3233338 RepID=UPI00355C2657